MICPFTLRQLWPFVVLACLTLVGYCQTYATAETVVEVTFRDKTSGEMIASRIEFIKPLTKAPRPRNSLVAGRQLLVEGTARFSPTPGAYEFMVRRGPEFLDVRSGFEVERNAQDAFEVVVPHKTPMRSFGWYSGDLQCAMPPDRLRRWMRADDLDLAASRFIETAASTDSVTVASTPSKQAVTQDKAEVQSSAIQETVPRSLDHVQFSSRLFDKPGQGGLLVHSLSDQVHEMRTSSSVAFLDGLDDRSNSFIEITKPWDRDVPLLLATEKIDAVQLLSSHLQPNSALALASTIRNPDPLRFHGRKGLARLGEYLYWQILEAGFRLPPTAGSGFDEKGLTHLGYNRVYIWLAPELPRDVSTWWTQLRRGHTLVTNGPLLRATINGSPPGAVFPNLVQESIPLEIELDLTVRDPVDYLDIIFNGKAIYQARLEDHAKRGKFPALNIKESGWLVLRVVTSHEASYRLATTAPFYFEFNNQARVSKSAIDFFREWLDESRQAIDRDATSRDDYREPLNRADEFWRKRAEQANKD